MVENSPFRSGPPLEIEKINYFFLKLDYFLSTFWKMCTVTIKIPKNLEIIIKNKLQNLASSDGRFCRGTRNDSRYTRNFVHDMHNFSLTWFFHLSMCLWSLGGGVAWGAPSEDPPIHEKKLIFRPFGTKKIEVENDPCWNPSPPRKWEVPPFFFIFWTLFLFIFKYDQEIHILFIVDHIIVAKE